MSDFTDPNKRFSRRNMLKIGAVGTVSVTGAILGGGIGYSFGSEPGKTVGIRGDVEEVRLQLQGMIGDLTELGAAP